MKNTRRRRRTSETHDETHVMLRLITMTTPHGEFTGYAYVETDNEGAVKSVEQMPAVWNDTSEAINAVHMMMNASQMPVLHLKKPNTVYH